MPDPYNVSPTDLLALIGTPACPIIIDVCTEPDFAQDPVLIPGARRMPHTDLAEISRHIAGCPGIIVCQKGLKLSQGVAAWLRATGGRAQVLRGGMVAWRATKGAPAILAAALPNRQEGVMRWVLPDDGDLTIGACAWLIHRFVDRDAEILTVAPDALPGVAQHFAATPLPAEATQPFAAFCKRLSLQTQALECLASVIDAADTGRWDGSPQATGLAAIWAGTPQAGGDSMAVLDALYRWAVDNIEGEQVGEYV